MDRLREQHEVDVWDDPLPPPPETLRERTRECEGLLSLLTDDVDAQLLDEATELRVVSNYAMGADNVDVEGALKRDIAVGVTPDVLTDATADLTMALILSAARRLPAAERSVRDGEWRTWEPEGFLGLELRGAVLGILGAGRIGRAVAERAEAFGMETLVATRRDPLAAVLERADVLTLHVPLTPDTRGLIGAKSFAQMKRSAILVNTSRGAVVDTDALCEALHEGEIAAAALDVTEPEPLPAGHPLLEAPNLVVVPHIGSATRVARERMADLAVDNLLAGLAGEQLPNPAT